MSVYLETNALRKLTSYECQESVYTSVFSIFELLSGITEEDFEIRKACLKRINEQKIKIKGPMIDMLFKQLLECSEYNCNKCANDMIMDIYRYVLRAKNYSDFYNLELLVTDINNKKKSLHAYTWLKNWDNNISNITNNVNVIFEEQNKNNIKNIYNKDGVRRLAEYFWQIMYDNRINYERLCHAEPFIGADAIRNICEKADILFSKYNYKLFIVAQLVIFSKAFFIDGNTQNSNNASDLLHLLYLNEDDIFVSNDKIYQIILEANPEFKLTVLNNERNLSDLI